VSRYDLKIRDIGNGSDAADLTNPPYPCDRGNHRGICCPLSRLSRFDRAHGCPSGDGGFPETVFPAGRTLFNERGIRAGNFVENLIEVFAAPVSMFPCLPRAGCDAARRPAGFPDRTGLAGAETQSESICLNFLVNRFNTAGTRPAAGGRAGRNPGERRRVAPGRETGERWAR